MGLDMYLSKRHSFNPYGNGNRLVESIVSPHKSIRPERIRYIDEEIMYWRKANQIHRWFVENVQEGRDECQEAELTREDLQQLYDVVLAVSIDHSKAEELLPTQSGFFFGSEDYDEGYFDDVMQTLDALREELGVEALVGEDIWYVYRASW